MLLEKADVQGYLTTDDLVEVYPDVGRDADRRETLFTLLRRQGVEILDPDPAEIFAEEKPRNCLRMTRPSRWSTWTRFPAKIPSACT